MTKAPKYSGTLVYAIVILIIFNFLISIHSFHHSLQATKRFLRFKTMKASNTPFAGQTSSNSKVLLDCPPSRLVKQILKYGDYARGYPQSTDSVCIHWQLFNINGDLVQDSKESPIVPSYKFGSGKLLRGWEIALKSMLVKEVSVIDMTSDFAFGEVGLAPQIGRNEPVRTIVELLEVSTSPLSLPIESANTTSPFYASESFTKFVMQRKPQSSRKEPSFMNPSLHCTSNNQLIQGFNDNISWHETKETLDIFVPIDESVCSTDIGIDNSGYDIKIRVGPLILLAGTYFGEVHRSCDWSIEEDSALNQGMGRRIHVALEKRLKHKDIWATIFKKSSG